MFCDPLDMSSIVNLRIGFNFKSLNFEEGEEFSLALSADNGSTFTQIDKWVYGVNFVNNTTFYEQVTISGSELSNSVVLRFECHASINSDQVFLDNIILESCSECIDYVVDMGFDDLEYDTSALISIQSNGIVKTGYHINYNAGQSVILEKGFEVEDGSTFHAFIQSCQ